MKKLLIILSTLATTISLSAQTDTSDIYADRSDSLRASGITALRKGNYLPKGDVRLEVISAAGLQKMACCNLAESFENSASVTVGYSDAATGARQIRLLGLSGVYTQMLDENRPVMRGITTPFGLTFIPGQWLESIQIAKGSSSVINGVESLTGQINLEHKKPTDEKPFFLSLTGMSDSRISGDIVSSLQIGGHWSTVLMGHADANFKSYDMNDDGFMDDPKVRQVSLGNRWLYYDPRFQVRFGWKAIADRRKGGSPDYDRKKYDFDSKHYEPWGTNIADNTIGAYLKVGVPLREDQSSSIALIADWTYQDMDAWFGAANYDVFQNSTFVNLLYRNQINEAHDFTAGISSTVDIVQEDLDRPVRFRSGLMTAGGKAIYGINSRTPLANVGAYGEYTFHAGETFSAIAGLRADWFNEEGIKLSPRLTAKYKAGDNFVLRLNGGRGLRRAFPLTDNIGVLSTGKYFQGDFFTKMLEDAWTYGGSAAYYFSGDDSQYISFDWFRTDFANQLVVDYENEFWQDICFYPSDGRKFYSSSFQAELALEPFKGMTVDITARYTDAKGDYKSVGLASKPMTSRFKGVINLQYKTAMSKWIFDFTAALNGSQRVWWFMSEMKDENGKFLYPKGRTPVYPTLHAQITRRFRGFDVYIGGENLTGFRQKHVLLGTTANGKAEGRNPAFDASGIWGPLMGARFDAGIRITIWKTY